MKPDGSSIVDHHRWFLGDLSDPWVMSLARPLILKGVKVFPWPESLPTLLRSLVDEPLPDFVVLHRSIFTEPDERFLRSVRLAVGKGSSLILCFGMYFRHADLERMARWVDLTLSEASSAEVLGRHLGLSLMPPTDAVSTRGRDVAVVSGSHDVGLSIVEMLRAGHHRPALHGQVQSVGTGSLVVWQVPTLDHRWPSELAQLSATSRVIALLGYADRRIVELARSSGASSCLEWPCDPEDLLASVEREGELRVHGGHPAIPMPRPRILSARKNLLGADLATGI